MGRRKGQARPRPEGGEEAEGLRVKVEEVAHAEGVVGGVLLEEGGEVDVCGSGGFCVEEEVGGGDGEEGA